MPARASSMFTSLPESGVRDLVLAWQLWRSHDFARYSSLVLPRAG